MNNNIQAVLFDLDGTLVDTAPDLLYALNKLRAERQLPPLPLDKLRAITSLGAKAMMELAFDFKESTEHFAYLKERFLNFYLEHIADATQLFPQMDTVLKHLEDNGLPWGVVTNKSTLPTNQLLKALKLDDRAACIVCGDTLSTCKPDPAPIIHACDIIQQKPADCLYVGDAITDVTASKKAGTKSLVALYGYIHHDDDPRTWRADGYINKPIELIDWLLKYPMNQSD